MNVNLSIKPVYFDSIRRGVKRTEYRDLTPYYVGKFVDTARYPGLTAVEIAEALRRGEPLFHRAVDTLTLHDNKRGRTMVVAVVGIKVYDHHTSLAIRLGDIVSVKEQ